MTQFEKIGVLVITGLVAVILALALFGAGSAAPLDADASPPGPFDAGATGQLSPEAQLSPGSPGESTSPGALPSTRSEPIEDLGVTSAPWFLLDDTTEGPLEETLTAADDPGASARPGEIRYTLKRGDSLYVLADKFLGNGARYRDILRMNPSLDPKRLQPGMVIRIPAVSADPGEQALRALARKTEPGVGTVTPRPAPEVVRYTVRKGDTLSGIAKKLFNDSSQWEELLALNRDQLDAPTSLRAGQQLRVPAVK